MEDTLKQILSELKELKTDVKGLKDGQKFLLNRQFKLEEKVDNILIELDKKLDKIYINTVGIAKQFTDTTQELPVLKSRGAFPICRSSCSLFNLFAFIGFYPLFFPLL
jgi:hypothetical protein